MGATVSRAQRNFINKLKLEMNNQIYPAILEQEEDIEVEENKCSTSLQGIYNIDGSCLFNYDNKCNTNANLTISSVAQAAFNAFKTMSRGQQTEILSKLNLGISNPTKLTKNIIQKALINNCGLEASSTSFIATGNVNMSCPYPGFKINTINTGIPSGNCAINVVLNTISDVFIQDQNSHKTISNNRINDSYNQVNDLYNKMVINRGYNLLSIFTIFLSVMFFFFLILTTFLSIFS